MTVCDRIREQMERLSLSYGELAHLTGLSKSAIHRYATGQTDKIPADALEKLARALRVTPAFLSGWTEDGTTLLAAHFDGTDFTKEEWQEIEEFVRFVKSRRPH